MARVVVIDDRVTNRNILTRLALSVEEGLQVSAFGDAAEALERMRQGLQPDLIITDFNMPEMDGATFIRHARSMPALTDVPIVVITVYEDREYCYRALEAGATDFLLSPVDHLEFRARARNLLTLRRQRLLLEDRASQLETALNTRFGHAPDEPARLQTFLDALPIAVSAVDAKGGFVFVNSAHEQLFGVSRDQILGRSLAEVHGEDYATRHQVLNDKVLQSGRPLASPRYDAPVDETAGHWLAMAKAPLTDQAGEVRQVLTVAMDLGELRSADALEAERERSDRLTGLASARVFRDRLEQEIARARRQNEMLAVLLVDLDRFKGLNEAFGEGFGDGILRAVGDRLAERVRETDILARLGSDEFAVLQTGLRRPDEAAELCRRLSETFAEPFLVGGQEVHLSASIGITIFPGDGRTVDTLLRNADLAMYRAKASGRDTYRFFAREMNVAARRAVTLERELRQALAADQFVLHYQPQLRLDTGKLIGMEALIRWNHPARGLIRPGEFIRLAEEIGLMAPMTAWVLQTACRQHRQWRDGGLEGAQLSVNLSPVQFRERGVELMIERVLAESGLPPESLDLELTENAVIENSQTASASLRYLNRLGVSLSIDDFGTGYSSLSYVKRLPVQRLKIDQSFVQNVEHGANDELIVRAIINLGHSLGLRVIGEGVETREQLERLRKLGCDEVQGDFIAPPLEVSEFERRLAEGTLSLDMALR